jgi:hypothetical protein
MMDPAPLRRGLLLEVRQLVAIETAARELFSELDRHCPQWRADALSSEEGSDGVNRAWRALFSALGEPEHGSHG